MERKRAVLALLLLVPAPSIGVLFAMTLFPDSPVGKAVYSFCKVWILAFPILWFKFVEGGKPSLSPLKRGGLAAGLLSGVLIGLFILVAYRAMGSHLIDEELFRTRLREVGLGQKGLYVGCALYWILVNSLLEEYVWRWFVVKESEAVFSPKLAVICSALFFTLHHVLAMRVFLGTAAVALGSAGVFAGGAIWSWMYMRYRSIWPGYASHALADLAIFGIGAVLLFG